MRIGLDELKADIRLRVWHRIQFPIPNPRVPEDHASTACSVCGLWRVGVFRFLPWPLSAIESAAQNSYCGKGNSYVVVMRFIRVDIRGYRVTARRNVYSNVLQ